MKTTATLKTASAYGGPAVFGAGLFMFAVALTASSRGPASAAPRPAPTVTVTESAAPVTVRPSPHAGSSLNSTPAGGALAASAREDAAPERAGGGISGSQVGPSVRPSSPQRPSAVRRPRGVVLSARALDVSARVHIGGR